MHVVGKAERDEQRRTANMGMTRGFGDMLAQVKIDQAVRILRMTRPFFTIQQREELWHEFRSEPIPDSLISKEEREKHAELAEIDQERVQLARAFESIHGRRGRVRRHDSDGTQGDTD
jgi:hypothetical protein